MRAGASSGYAAISVARPASPDKAVVLPQGLPEERAARDCPDRAPHSRFPLAASVRALGHADRIINPGYMTPFVLQRPGRCFRSRIISRPNLRGIRYANEA